MIDPVTGFLYPELWVSRCPDPERLRLVEEGRAVLTSSGRTLRRGYTTGTTAAAACQAAISSFPDRRVNRVEVRSACGLVLPVEVQGQDGRASCFKFSGDHPHDATAGIEIRAELIGFREESAVDIGPGIGRWDRDTPRYRTGSPAVSRTAMDCIHGAITMACRFQGERGAEVRLRAVKGEEVARRTLNGRIGVQGGISILGSTGLVGPWDDHLGQDSMARASAARQAVITTGRVGLRHARLQYPDEEVVLVGANLRSVLECKREGLTLFGLPALILRYIDPHVLEGTGYRTVEELVCSDQGKEVLRSSVIRFKRLHPGHGIVIIDREGRALEAAP